MDDISRMNEFAANVRLLVVSKIKDGTVVMPLEDLNYMNITYWPGKDENLLFGLESSFESKLTPELLNQIYALW